jgi:transcriptional regulator with XRE-family HTH domain
MSRELSPADKQLKKSIALRLKELREETGKNVSEFAAEMETERQNQHRLEQGRGATIYSISRFCKTRGITLSQFFDSPLFKDAKK